MSEHQLAQVIVNRKDKEGRVLVGRERVCLDCRPINKGFRHYKYPIPSINKMLRTMSKSHYYSKLDLTESFEQFRISEELSNYLTFMTSFGKVSMLVLTYEAESATDKVQETMTHKFFEFLETWLLLYVDNMLVITLTRRAHLEALRNCLRDANELTFTQKCSFLWQSIKTMDL